MTIELYESAVILKGINISARIEAAKAPAGDILFRR
jgi:hypothetical protein